MKYAGTVNLAIAARLYVAVQVAIVSSAGTAVAGFEMRVTGPTSLEGFARRIRQTDQRQLEQALERAGLQLPRAVHITLIPEHDPRARQTPAWIVGRAFGSQDVVVFPERVMSYPHNSLSSVVRHEIVHLALSARAGGQPLPRWFHEGVAVSVEARWGLSGSLRLLLAAAENPAVADLDRLFDSDRQAETSQAYSLAAALIDDVRQRHGAAAPGAIARHVAGGTPFDRAFALETGETTDEAAARAWRAYRRWGQWVPVVTSPTSLWTLILLLAFVAFVARAYQRQRRRRLWDEEENAQRIVVNHRGSESRGGDE